MTAYNLTSMKPCWPMKVVEQCPRHSSKTTQKNGLENIVVEKLEEGRHIYINFQIKHSIEEEE